MTEIITAEQCGIKIGAFPSGPFKAITDVPGVRVGHVTVSHGDGKLVVGKGPARTGVTVILPTTGDIWRQKLCAGSFVLNGCGEGFGLMWLQESGWMETPIALTNTMSVGAVQRGLVQWMTECHPEIGINDDTVTPLVFECDDSTLSDAQGQHVTEQHVLQAIEQARSGPIEQGGVGAGTGMMSYEFKGGIGSASRVIEVDGKKYTLGVLVNANHGRRNHLRILGTPVGNKIPDLLPDKKQEGSIVIIIATDLPLDARQLSRLAKRSALGLARTGATARHGSGDIVVAFSTANKIAHQPEKPIHSYEFMADIWLNDAFEAVGDATEESVINALLNGKTTIGRDGYTAHGFPVERLKNLLPKE